MTYDINSMKPSEPHDCSTCVCPTCIHGPFYQEPCPCGNNCDVCTQNNKSMIKMDCEKYCTPGYNTERYI